MHIWLVQIGEPMPTDNAGRDRLLRTGQFAEHLVSEGHEVTWWSSDFDHQRKKHRHGETTRRILADGLRLHFLHGHGYCRNVSLARVADHWQVAREFRCHARAERAPDVVVASLPPIRIALEAVEYCRRTRTPCVLDVRDLWPDVFLDLVPRRLRLFARIALAPAFRDAQKAFSGAHAITGVTEGYVTWALDIADRRRAFLDRVFPFTYKPLSRGAYEDVAAKVLGRYGVRAVGETFVACFIGTIGRQFDIETVLAAARLLNDQPDRQPRITFVLCGTGDSLDRYRRSAADCPNVVFTGWLAKDDLAGVLAVSDVGLAPYVPSGNFLRNIPNKIGEYLAAGLPILAGLGGEMGTLLRESGAGLVYRTADAPHLADLLCTLAGSRRLRARMSERARSVYERRFAPEIVHPAMLDHLNEVVRSHRNSASRHAN